MSEFKEGYYRRINTGEHWQFIFGEVYHIKRDIKRSSRPDYVDIICTSSDGKVIDSILFLPANWEYVHKEFNDKLDGLLK